MDEAQQHVAAGEEEFDDEGHGGFPFLAVDHHDV
jgi:hypothetical protein